MAIPKSLISREMLTQMQGIKSYRTSLVPTNTSGSYIPSGNNRILFTIPAYENCMLNTRRSYIHFKLQATGPNADNAILTHGAPVFRRLMIKNSRGSVISDIDNYDTYCRIMTNMKPLAELRGKSSVSYDNRAVGGVDWQEDFFTNGKTVIHELMDGVLGKEQQFLIPVSSMLASSGHSFQIELWLSDSKNVFSASKGDALTSEFSYKITDVAYDIELVELSPELMNDINTEIAGGQSIPIPYRSVKSYRNQVSNGTSYKAQITDFSANVEAVYSVIRKQSAGSSVALSVNELTSRATNIDPYRFMGGRFNIDKTNTLNPSDVIVNRYSYKYGAHYFPLAPVSLDYDSTLALENIISGFELDDKVPFIAEKIGTTGKKVARFETDLFVLATNFKTTKDANLVNGLNSASSGAPLELDVQFENEISQLLIDTFVVSTQTLYIKANGSSSLTKD